MSYYGLVDYMVWAHLKWGLAMLFKVFINEWLADTKETQVKTKYYFKKRERSYVLKCWKRTNIYFKLHKFFFSTKNTQQKNTDKIWTVVLYRKCKNYFTGTLVKHNTKCT